MREIVFGGWVKEKRLFLAVGGYTSVVLDGWVEKNRLFLAVGTLKIVCFGGLGRLK